MEFEPVIGLEVHVQLKTKSKIFCGCATSFGAEPNSNTCPVCLGLPGSLPVLNKEALRLAIKVGLALDCKVAERLKFDRKNYFYPDLPKAYQISQFDLPVNGKGHIQIALPDGEKKEIGITRAHLEEDAGKLLHEGIIDGSHVDYNRTGTPLLEIVSEPDMRTPEEAYAYLTSLKAILEYLEVSDCNMEEGSLRCDANISIRPRGEKKLGTKAEIKNLNSFKAVQRALAYEIERQIEHVQDGEEIVQETRLWNDARGITVSMRSKEEAHDYRYFPEPDLVPFTIASNVIEEIRATLPELPRQKQERFITDWCLSRYDASVLVQEKRMADFFEQCVSLGREAKTVSNWIQSELLGIMNTHALTWETLPITPEAFAKLIELIDSNKINGKIAKQVLPLMVESGKDPEVIVEEKGLVQVTDENLINELAEKIIAANPKSVEDYKSGNKKAIGFLVGQMMKETKGKANPQIVNQILHSKLERQ